jgi:hypothetical protein
LEAMSQDCLAIPLESDNGDDVDDATAKAFFVRHFINPTNTHGALGVAYGFGPAALTDAAWWHPQGVLALPANLPNPLVGVEEPEMALVHGEATFRLGAARESGV